MGSFLYKYTGFDSWTAVLVPSLIHSFTFNQASKEGQKLIGLQPGKQVRVNREAAIE